MFSETAALYDAIYGHIKDYPAEATAIAGVIRDAHKTAHSVLDICCGTGEHARLLDADHGFAVDGLDLDPAFVAIAQAKLPARQFTVADMTELQLGRRYDAVVCLFGSIGYTVTVDKLHAAIARMRAHLAPGGVVIVEGFLTPERYVPGTRGSLTVEHDGMTITRVNHSTNTGTRCDLHFDYTLTRPGEPPRELHELHVLGLFSEADLRAAFAAAGLAVSFDPDGGPSKRGLYVAREATA